MGAALVRGTRTSEVSVHALTALPTAQQTGQRVLRRRRVGEGGRRERGTNQGERWSVDDGGPAVSRDDFAVVQAVADHPRCDQHATQVGCVERATAARTNPALIP